MAKFIQTLAIYYGGAPTPTTATIAALAKHDIIDIDRFRYNQGVSSGTLWSAIKAINPNVKIISYIIGVEATNGTQDNSTMPFVNELARYNVSRGHPMGSLNGNNPGFFLTSGGARIFNKDFSPGSTRSYLLDFGSSSYQNYFNTAVHVDLNTAVWANDGCFFDVCVLHSTDVFYINTVGGSRVLPTIYNTEANWTAAMQVFIRAVTASMRADGKISMFNSGGSRDATGQAAIFALDTGANAPDWLMEEAFVAVKFGVSNGVQWLPTADWKRQVDVLKNLQHTGFALISSVAMTRGQTGGGDNQGTSNVTSFWQVFYYALASYCLGKNDVLNNHCFYFDPNSNYNAVQWYDEYDKINFGPAVSNYLSFTSGSATIYWREFESGYVYVNPTNNNSGTITLPQACRNINNTNINSNFSGISTQTTFTANKWTGTFFLKTTPSGGGTTPGGGGGGTGGVPANTQLVQQKLLNGSSGSSGTTIVVTMDNNVVAGNALIVTGFWGTGVAADFVSIADTRSSVYQQVDTKEFSFDVFKTFLAENISGGACTITITLNTSRAYRCMMVQEVSGVKTSGALDKHAINSQQPAPTTTNGTTSGSVTPGTDAAYVYGSSVVHNVLVNAHAAGTGFSMAGSSPGDSTHPPMAHESLQQSLAAPVSATFTLPISQFATTAIMTLHAAQTVVVGSGASAFVQGASLSGDSTAYGLNMSKALTSNATAGNLLAVAVMWGFTGAVTVNDLDSVSDSQGNTYIRVAQLVHPGGNMCMVLLVAQNIRAGATTVTANLNISSSMRSLVIHEVSGLAISNAVDPWGIQSWISPSSATDAITSPPGQVTSEANEYAFGVCSVCVPAATTINAGTGWTSRTNDVGDSTHPAIRSESRVITNAGSVQATFTNGSFNEMLAGMISFKLQPTGTQIRLSGVSASSDVGELAPVIGEPPVYGTETIALFEIDQPFCTLTYGVLPCQAALGVTGDNKCYNTRPTCQDPVHYNARKGFFGKNVITLRFGYGQNELQKYAPLIPSINSIDTTPASLNLAAMNSDTSALGSREVITLKVDDHLHSDNIVDKYRLERISGLAQADGIGYDPYDRGTFWSKYLPRNKFLSSYRCRLYEGQHGTPVKDMRVRNYVIDRIEGPTNGEVTIVAKDLFSIIENAKSVAPKASGGQLVADITAVATQAILSPQGIGSTDYTNSPLYVAIGHEVIACTRFGDTLNLNVRGALGTKAEAHEAEDLVQQVLTFSPLLAHEIMRTLVLNYTDVSSTEFDYGQWVTALANYPTLYSTRIATPTPVADLIGELAEQVGFTIWPDLAENKIKIAALSSRAPSAAVDDENWIIKDSLKVKFQEERRVSQVWTYYGQIDPTLQIDQKENFHSRVVTVDLDAEGTDQYEVPRIKEIFSRWIPQFGRNFATQTGNRVLAMFRDAPLEAEFKIDASAKRGQITPANYFTLNTSEVIDINGQNTDITMAAVEIENGETEIAIRAQQVAFATETSTGERVIYIETNVNNFNMRTAHNSLYKTPVAGDIVRVILIAGVFVGSSGPQFPSFTVGIWPAGVTLYLEIYGQIRGAGGFAGKGGDCINGTPSNGTAGSVGGTALLTTVPIHILGTGLIAGGGGGGGGGGAAVYPLSYVDQIAGGGGGGAAGLIASSGAIGGSAVGAVAYPGDPGTPGGLQNFGQGGAAHVRAGDFYGGAGGVGGGYGLAGTAGSPGHGVSGFGVPTDWPGGAGGPAGFAFTGGSHVIKTGTWVQIGPSSG